MVSDQSPHHFEVSFFSLATIFKAEGLLNDGIVVICMVQQIRTDMHMVTSWLGESG